MANSHRVCAGKFGSQSHSKRTLSKSSVRLVACVSCQGMRTGGLTKEQRRGAHGRLMHGGGGQEEFRKKNNNKMVGHFLMKTDKV